MEIRLHKYFFEIENYIFNKVEMGESRRSLGGRNHNIRFGSQDSDYYTFSMEIPNLKTKELLNLYLITEYLKTNDFIEFEDDKGNIYKVIIPLPLDDSISVSGDDNNYDVSLSIEEYGGD